MTGNTQCDNSAPTPTPTPTVLGKKGSEIQKIATNVIAVACSMLQVSLAQSRGDDEVSGFGSSEEEDEEQDFEQDFEQDEEQGQDQDEEQDQDLDEINVDEMEEDEGINDWQEDSEVDDDMDEDSENDLLKQPLTDANIKTHCCWSVCLDALHLQPVPPTLTHPSTLHPHTAATPTPTTTTPRTSISAGGTIIRGARCMLSV